MYQPKTGQKCSCKRGVQRDNCPECEGTGWVIDFRAIRERTALARAKVVPVPVVAVRPNFNGANPFCGCDACRNNRLHGNGGVCINARG